MKKKIFQTLMSITFLFCNNIYAGSIKPYDLLCEMQPQPLGIETNEPSLSWKLSSSLRNQHQTAYQVLVADNPEQLKQNNGNFWNSGKVESSQSLHILYRGKKLLPAKKYYWKIKVWDNNYAPSEWSHIESWQMGLPQQSDWQDALWIGMDKMENTQRLAQGIPFTMEWQNKKIENFPVNNHALPVFRKEISLKKKIKSASAFVCGLGQFEFFLNGKKVSNHFLDPGWTNYDQYALYASFDITGYMKTNKNVFGIMLGNGFYYIPNVENRWKPLANAFGYPCVKAKIIITYSDGSNEEVVTNPSWKVTEGPVSFTTIFGGEDYDATRELPGWYKAGYDDSQWKNSLAVDGPVHLVSQQSNFLTINKIFEAANISEPKAGIWIYDFGQNASAIPAIKVSGKKGAVIKLIPGELLDSANLVTQKGVGGPVYFTYTLKGDSIETWQPQFTYYGYRYVQVEGAVPEGKANASGQPVILNMKSLHTGNAAATVGSFKCSDKLFTDIFKLIDWSVKSNMASVLTDCPHREKTGWLEVSYLMESSIMYNYDAYALYKKIIDDVIAAQYPTGRFPDYAPEYYRMPRFSDFPEWGSTGVILPWYIYKRYGDKKILQTSYSSAKKYVEYLRSKADSNIVSFGIGDWFDIGPKPVGPSQLTPLGVTATATYYYDVTILANMAKLLNQDADYNLYNKLAAEVKYAFNKKYFNKETKQYATGSQTANAMAIFMNLVSPEYITEVLKNIVVDIAQRNYALTSGDIGYRYLLKVLEEGNAPEVIYKMNSRSDVPGYGYQLEKGATALTESWQAFPYVSNNHCMLGHLMEWFYGGLCGIKQDDNSVAFKEIIISPQPVENISFAEASYNSPYGTIKSSWNKVDGRFELEVEIPANTTAKVFIPANSIDDIIESGKTIKNKKQFQFEGYKDGKVIIRIGSGAYKFVVVK